MVCSAALASSWSAWVLANLSCARARQYTQVLSCFASSLMAWVAANTSRQADLRSAARTFQPSMSSFKWASEALAKYAMASFDKRCADDLPTAPQAQLRCSGLRLMPQWFSSTLEVPSGSLLAMRMTAKTTSSLLARVAAITRLER